MMTKMAKKLTTDEILHTIFAVVLLICLMCGLMVYLSHVNTKEDPVARTNYVGPKQYSTRWHGND